MTRFMSNEHEHDITNSRDKQITKKRTATGYLFSYRWHDISFCLFTQYRMQYNCTKKKIRVALPLQMGKAYVDKVVCSSLFCYLLPWSNPTSRFKFSVILVPVAVSVANDEYVIFWRRYISAMVCINKWQVCWPPTL